MAVRVQLNLSAVMGMCTSGGAMPRNVRIDQSKEVSVSITGRRDLRVVTVETA